MVAETTEDFLHDFAVFFHRLCEDEDVVHVDDKNVATDEVTEDVVHHVLECRRRVRETEEHDRGFEEAAIGNESRLPLVAFLDADVVEAPTHVHLGEDLGVFDLVNDVRDEG